MFDNDGDDFVRSPENCNRLGLECRSCISEVAHQMAGASPELTPAGAAKLFKIMYEQPSCRSMENTFLHAYQMKRSMAIDYIADRDLAAADQMILALATTAPGTAEMIGAQAGAWVVRSQAYI